MFRSVALFLCAIAGSAQTPANPSKTPPPDVDKALRARITEFYQDFVEGKFRQAEALVAEDTKDFYYGMNKARYVSFEIQKIDYSDNFTHARAIILSEQYVMLPGFADKPLKLPSQSTWKLVDGQWYWYIDPDAVAQTPFGKVPLVQLNPSASAPPTPPKIPTAQDLAYIFKQVKADKDAVNLKPGEPAQVTITNTAQGQVSLTVLEAPAKVEAKLEHANIAAGGKIELTIRAESDAKPGVVSLRVDQTNQVIPIQVTIQ